MAEPIRTPGEALAAAVAGRDRECFVALLAEDIDFTAMTPRRTWTATTPAEVDAIVFDHWFEEHDRVERLAAVQRNDDVGDTAHVGYRLDLACPSGPHVVEQQAYYRTEGDRISYLRILCSGFRPR